MIYWLVVGREMDGNELKHIRLLSDKGQRQTMTPKQLRSFQKNNTVVNVKYQGESLHGIGMEMRDIPTYQKQKGGIFQQTGGQTEQLIIQRSYPLIQQLQQKELNKLQKQANSDAQEKEELDRKRKYVVQKLIAIDRTMQYIGAMKDITNEQITNNQDIMRYLKQLDISNSDMSIEYTIQTYGVKGLVHKLDESLDRLEHRSKKFNLTGLNIGDLTQYQTILQYINVLRPRVKQLIKKHEATYDLIKQNREDKEKAEQEQKKAIAEQKQQQKKAVEEQQEQQKHAVKLEKAIVNSVEDEDQDNVLIVDKSSELSKDDIAVLESLTGKTIEVKSKEEVKQEQKKQEKKELPSFTSIIDMQTKSVNMILKKLRPEVISQLAKSNGLEDNAATQFGDDSDVKDSVKTALTQAAMSSRQQYVNRDLTVPGLERFIIEKYKHNGSVISDNSKSLMCIDSSQLTDADFNNITISVITALSGKDVIQAAVKRYKKKEEKKSELDSLLTGTEILLIQKDTSGYVFKTQRFEIGFWVIQHKSLFNSAIYNVIRDYWLNKLSDKCIPIVNNAIRDCIESTLKGSRNSNPSVISAVDNNYMLNELKPFVQDKYKHINSDRTVSIISKPTLVIRKEQLTEPIINAVNEHVAKLLAESKSIQSLADRIERDKAKEVHSGQLNELKVKIEKLDKEIAEYRYSLGQFRSSLAVSVENQFMESIRGIYNSTEEAIVPINLLSCITDALTYDDASDYRYYDQDNLEFINESEYNTEDIIQIANAFSFNEDMLNESINAFEESLTTVLSDNIRYIGEDNLELAFTTSCEGFYNDNVKNFCCKYNDDDQYDDDTRETWMNHIGNLVETAYYVRDSIKSKISDDHGHNYKWYESAVRELEELKEKLTNESQINIGTDAQEAHTHTTASRKGIEESLSMYSDI